MTGSVHARGTTIGFEPPLSHLAGSLDAFQYIWELIQYVFDLPDPGGIPAVDVFLSAHDLNVLARFDRAAAELAESPFLAYSARMDVHVTGVEETVISDFPPAENERGFAVLLRQFLGNEPASFNKVCSIAWRANDQAADANLEERRDVLRQWRIAERKLRNRTPNVWVGLKLAREGKMSGPPPGLEMPPVESLISVFNYGDLIHWGRRAGQLKELTSSDFDDAYVRMTLYQGMAGLAHLYMGSAVLLQRMFPETDPHATAS